jgi:hemolysin type calcium-binding protein
MAKRIVLMVTAALMAASMMAPAALAVDKQCTLRPCEGTNNRDILYERSGRGVPDIIYGKRGGDRIRADLFGADRDVLYGGRGDDILRAQDRDGRDVLYGGRGDDVCYVDEGDSYVGCEEVALVIE